MIRTFITGAAAAVALWAFACWCKARTDDDLVGPFWTCIIATIVALVAHNWGH
jgi:hypothetical protein